MTSAPPRRSSRQYPSVCGAYQRPVAALRGRYEHQRQSAPATGIVASEKRKSVAQLCDIIALNDQVTDGIDDLIFARHSGVPFQMRRCHRLTRVRRHRWFPDSSVLSVDPHGNTSSFSRGNARTQPRQRCADTTRRRGPSRLGRTNYLAPNRKPLRDLQKWVTEFNPHWGSERETLKNYAQYLGANHPEVKDKR